MTTTKLADVVESTAIRPFQVNVPEADLADLRRRIVATRWPEKETVSDTSQGVQLAFLQALAQYWATDYDWRKVRGEAELPTPISSPRSTASTFISSTFVQSMRMRCRSSSLTAGPARHRAAEDHRSADQPHGSRRQRVGCLRPGDPVDGRLRVFRQADDAGWDPARMARAWVELMKRLGYTPIRGARR